MPDASADLSLAAADIRWLRSKVRDWFSVHGRPFRWRQTDDPFEVIIAELLLQRTRADLVPAVFDAFIDRYPSAHALANAPTDEVVELLRPLGLLHRSTRLNVLARDLVTRFNGAVPHSYDALRSLPGVGPYVANAVLLVAFSQPRPLVDPNVIRLLDRCFGLRSAKARPREDTRVWEVVARIVPSRNPVPVALGLVDLGTLICLRGRPRCAECPLQSHCAAYRFGLVTPARH